jgi:hypothetical protein
MADLRLDLPGRYRLTLGGKAEPFLALLRAAGVSVVEAPRHAGEGWEGQVQTPPGWSNRRLLELLVSSEDGRETVLRAFVPKEERLNELFDRLTGHGAAAGPGAVHG